MTDREARLLDVADKLDIHDLLAIYSMARDDRDLARLIATFTPDAEFVRGAQVVKGHDEIREFFRKSMSRYDISLHTVHVPVVRITTPDTATGILNGHAELVLNKVPHLAAYRYTDAYRRVDGQWLIARRHLRFMYAVAASEYSNVFANTRRIQWPGQDAAEADYPETLPVWNSYLT